MSIYNNKHVVFEQVGVDSDTVVWNQSTNTDGDGAYNNYEISNIRNTVLPTKALALSNELYATLTNTTIQTAKNGKSTSLVSTSDKTFILAEKEMTANPNYAVSEESNAFTTLGYWVNHTSSGDRVKKDPSNVAQRYWLRSAYTNAKDNMVVVYLNGNFGNLFATGYSCIAQCFAY